MKTTAYERVIRGTIIRIEYVVLKWYREGGKAWGDVMRAQSHRSLPVLLETIVYSGSATLACTNCYIFCMLGVSAAPFHSTY